METLKVSISEAIEIKTLTEGGCTFSVVNEKLLSAGEPVYLISLHKELEEIIPVAEFNTNTVKMFILKNYELLQDPSTALGTWVNEGSVYLDVTTIVDKENSSIEELKAMTTDQLAGWDLELNEVINF